MTFWFALAVSSLTSWPMALAYLAAAVIAVAAWYCEFGGRELLARVRHRPTGRTSEASHSRC